MAQHGHLTSEEKKKIRIGRRKLRKDLREQGITKRRDFEEIAQMLGLVYGDEHPPLLWFWWHLKDWLAGLGLKAYLTMGGIFLGIVFPLAIIANQKGNFMVSMSDTQMMRNLVLYDNSKLEEGRSFLASDVLNEVNPYTLMDIPANVNDLEGSHNLDDLVAYTFWAVNEGEEPLDYNWYIVMTNSTKNVQKATWLMIFDEDGTMIYALENPEGEELVPNCFEPFFMERSSDKASQYIPEDSSGHYYSVVPKCWEGEHMVTEKNNMVLQPGEAKKYTVAIWVEGYDQDCDQSLVGGHAGFRMFFTAVNDDDSIVKKYFASN